MGCCSSRANDDGSLEYSNTNKDKILEAISGKKELSLHYQNGWRLHHQVEVEKGKVKSFLSHARESGNLEVFKTSHFSVSQEALLETAAGQLNYEFVFANWDLVNQLSQNYVSAGFVLTNEAAIDFFLAQEKIHSGSAEKSKPFVLLRAAFGVTKAPLAEKKEEVKGDAKPVSVDGKSDVKEAPKIDAPVEKTA